MSGAQLSDALQVAGQKHNRYCGPASLAAVAGINTGEAAAILRDVSGKRAIISVRPDHLAHACKRAGLEFRDGGQPHYFPLGKLPTFAQYFDEWHDGGLCILYVTGHYVAVSGDSYVDTFARRPSPATNYPKQRQRVRAVIKLRRIEA